MDKFIEEVITDEIDSTPSMYEEEIVEEKIIEPKLGDIFKYSDYMPYLKFAQTNGYQIIDYGEEDGEKLFMVREMPIIKPTKEQIAQPRIRQLKKLLSDTDYVAIKIAEGSATAEEYSEVLAQRKAWRAEINQLENLAVEPSKGSDNAVVELYSMEA